MQILGDLNENAGQESKDLPGSMAKGMSGNHEGQNSRHVDSEEPAINDVQAHEARERTGSGAQESEKDPRDAFVAASPPADFTARPRGGGKSGSRADHRIGEQILYPPNDINNREQLSSRRSNGGLWLALMMLVLALAGASAYFYLSLRNNNISLSEVTGLLPSIKTLGGRMGADEAKLRGLAANWDAMANQLAGLDRKVDSNLRAARNQTRELVGQAAGRLQAELDQQRQTVNARLNNVESMQGQDRAQLAQLNEQLRGQIASLREQLAAAQESTGHDLASLQGQMSEGQANLHTLAQQLHREKVTFEIVKDSPAELAPGVTLTVLKTEVSYQRFRGYISLTDEGKTLWLNLNAKEAVDLYSQRYSHPYSLIVTTVSNGGVVGYLLLPAGA